MDKPETIDDIFRLFGGPTAVARVIGKRPTTASEMKRRQSIPVRYWPSLLESARGHEIGLTSEILMEVHNQLEAAE